MFRGDGALVMGSGGGFSAVTVSGGGGGGGVGGEVLDVASLSSGGVGDGGDGFSVTMPEKTSVSSSSSSKDDIGNSDRLGESGGVGR